MKKLNLLLCLIALLLNTPNLLGQNIITVNNQPNNSPGQYDDLQEAIDAASPNDIIYIHRSPTSYGSVTITIPLTLIGTGYNPNNENSNDVSQLAGIDLVENALNGTNPSGTNIRGLKLGNINANTAEINNIEITDCDLNNIFIRENNILIANNYQINDIVAYNSDGFECNNVIIRNNYMQGSIIRNLLNSTCVISHNTCAILGFINCEDITLKDNIFYNQTSIGGDNCNFINNIAFNEDGTPLTSSTSSNTFTNNLGAMISDPLFLNFASSSALSNWDLTVSPGSAIAGAASDGTDIGFTGGVSPFTIYGEPPIPQIRSFNIPNNTAPVGGTIEINIQADGQN